MSSKREVLTTLSFGSQVAEDEAEKLASYFVETHLWRRLFSGEVDIIFGAKGSGKSAFYALLRSRADELAKNGVFILPAENPRGTPVFKGLEVDPPTTEREFQALWKLYFCSLVGVFLRRRHPADILVQQLVGTLEKAHLIEGEPSLASAFAAASSYVRRLFRPEAVEGGIKLDSMTGLPVGFSGKIIFGEPDAAQRAGGIVSAEGLLKLADEALRTRGEALWLLLDRLDNAFLESMELEQNALRALFKVYIDLRALGNIWVKIFLRDDIMRRITREGFRELSHLTRQATITWDEQSLLNLAIRRAVMNQGIRDFYDVSHEAAVEDQKAQEELFGRIFPEKVERGETRPTTFRWMLSHTCDGTGQTAPRELIHLLSEAKERQLRRIELGHGEPEGERLFEGVAVKEALPEVSKVRLNQTFLAEYPGYRRYVMALEGEKTEHTVATLGKLWNLSEELAFATAGQLSDLGFFESRGKGLTTYWVPFLYRHALSMSQGAAD